MAIILAAATAPALLTMAGPIEAQDDPTPKAAVAAEPVPVCTDRPTKANVVCTVPVGAIQIEADLVNWTRNSVAGVRTDTVLYTNPTIKYGLGGATDLEINVAPYATVRTRFAGAVDTIGGVGDLYVRVKQQVVGSGPIQVALIPYIKAPTARIGIGNGKVEGGVIAPIIFSLPKGVSLNFGPEVDVLENSDPRGRHAQLVGLANVSKGVGKATLYAELWTAQNFDPATTVRQYSADIALTYLFRPTLQIDVGGNFGLNSATPDAQLYAGIAKRF